MLIVDQRILELMDILKDLGVIKTKYEFHDTIGIFKSNIAEIRNQDKNNKVKHFTLEQVHKVIETYNINPSWVFGYETAIFRTKSAQFSFGKQDQLH